MVRSKPKRGAAAEPVIVDPTVVEPAVVDGLLIARSAATIGVANRVIMRALREQAAFDADETRAMVRDELGRLAREQEDLASRMVETRSRALKSRGRSKHQFDYRPDDNSALGLREAIYSTIAQQLDALSDDDLYVDDIATAARDRAWNDIGSAALSQVNAVVKPDRDYASKREERVRRLLDIDLAALSKAHPSGDAA